MIRFLFFIFLFGSCAVQGADIDEDMLDCLARRERVEKPTYSSPVPTPAPVPAQVAQKMSTHSSSAGAAAQFVEKDKKAIDAPLQSARYMFFNRPKTMVLAGKKYQVAGNYILDSNEYRATYGRTLADTFAGYLAGRLMDSDVRLPVAMGMVVQGVAENVAANVEREGVDALPKVVAVLKKLDRFAHGTKFRVKEIELDRLQKEYGAGGFAQTADADKKTNDHSVAERLAVEFGKKAIERVFPAFGTEPVPYGVIPELLYPAPPEITETLLIDTMKEVLFFDEGTLLLDGAEKEAHEQALHTLHNMTHGAVEQLHADINDVVAKHMKAKEVEEAKIKAAQIAKHRAMQLESHAKTAFARPVAAQHAASEQIPESFAIIAGDDHDANGAAQRAALKNDDGKKSSAGRFSADQIAQVKKSKKRVVESSSSDSELG